MFQQEFLVLIRSHLINGIELYLHPNISTEDGWQWTLSNESETNPFQQQVLVLIRSHLINGLELHLLAKLATEDGWQ